MLKFLKYLSLNRIGFLEIILALYPIMAAYKYGNLHLSHLVLIMLDVVILSRQKTRLLKFAPLLAFLIYYTLHQSFLIATGLTQSYYVNNTIENIIYLVSLFIIIPAIDFDNLEGSINWVSIVCLIGLFYHAVLVARGQIITPIQLPFFPTPEESQTRLFGEGFRPKSFFMEPQSYVSYMLFTLFFAIKNQKYMWAVLVGVSIILSTSTTGIVLIPIMLGLYLFSTKSKWVAKTITVIILAGLGYFFLNSEFSTYGVEKMQNTELSYNARTSNGPALVSAMDPIDFLFGVTYANATDLYNRSSTIDKGDVLLDDNNAVYVSGFWNALIFFGIIGLILFLGIYWSIGKKEKALVPLIGCFVVALFSNPDFIGVAWSFQIIYMLSFMKRMEKANMNHSLEHSKIKNIHRNFDRLAFNA